MNIVTTVAKKNDSSMLMWLGCCYGLLVLYGGIVLGRVVYSDTTLRQALFSILAGTPAVIAATIVYTKFSGRVKMMPVFVAAWTQLLFLGYGTYVQELELYFFMMILLLCIVMIIKNFRLLLATVIVMSVINCVFSIVFLPNIDWLDTYTFVSKFLCFIFGSGFFLMMTYNIEKKESKSDRALVTFSSLLYNTPNYMIVTGSKRKVRYISKPMAEFANFSSQDIAVGRPLLDLFEDRELKLMFADILNLDGFVEKIVPIKIKGKERYFRIIADKMDEKSGGMFIDIADITSTVKSKLTAEAADKSKSNFLATMSHEIRTPINAIIGIAQIHLQNEELRPESTEVMLRILTAGSNLLSIINDILDMSKIESGKMELAPAEYDVPSLINDTMQLNLVRIGSKHIEFVLAVKGDMPSTLYGDMIRIKQILNNMLSNAIKYTEKGHVKLSVSHITNGEDVILQFAIEDTGQGLKAEDKKRLFSEYLRFNTEANRATEGTGLGLNISKKLVELMGGTISVDSEYGKGSTFHIAIKQKAVPCSEIGEELASQLCNFTFAGFKRKDELKIVCEPMPYGSVLVVDDVETNLYVSNGLLKLYKLKVDMANSGFEAIDLVQNDNRYDIIFMDHMMPRMDGVETTRQLRELGYDGIIIALTANAMVGSEEMFRANGFDGFVAKPIDIRCLNKVLNEYICDRYPDEAKKYEPGTVNHDDTSNSDPKLLQIFCRDAEKAIVTLQETIKRDDITLFTTTAHAMKSALANVGEIEASKEAFALEEAGIGEDRELISTKIESFLETLKALIEKLRPPESACEDSENITEDVVFLQEQLLIIKTACEEYDDTAAYTTLNRLKEKRRNPGGEDKEKRWKPETAAAIEDIHDSLFLHSDFEKAAELTAALLESL